MQFVFILTESSSSSSCSYSVEGMPMDCEVRRWSHNLATFCLGCGPNNGSKVTSRVKSFFLWPKQVMWLNVCQHSLVTCDLGILLPPHSQRAWPTPRIGSYHLRSVCVCVKPFGRSLSGQKASQPRGRLSTCHLCSRESGDSDES